MYDNVIVPFDGSLPARAVLAPAGDLAWRFGARIVIVNNTETSDAESHAALKSRAISMSGADVDFWVDLEHDDLGDAVIEAARHRAAPLIAVPVRARTTGWRRRPVMGAVPAHVLRHSPVPVVVIGPSTDVTRGLPLAELVVALDGSAEAEQILPLVVTWAVELKISVRLVGVVRTGQAAAAGAERAYLDEQRARVAEQVPDTTSALVEGSDPAAGLVSFVAGRDNALLAMTTHGRNGIDDRPLGPVAQGVLVGCPRAMLFLRPSG